LVYTKRQCFLPKSIQVYFKPLCFEFLPLPTSYFSLTNIFSSLFFNHLKLSLCHKQFTVA
jgi:hypothetical protein